MAKFKHTRSYPLLNTDLQNMPKETWKDVPGFDGEYQVSSLGRIKSLSRRRNSGRDSGYYTKEIIRRQGLWVSKNKFLNEKTYSVSVGLKSHGKSISRSTARYVYYAFVKPFDLDDDSIIISHKDFDGLNLYYKNLFLTTRSETSKRNHSQGRTQSHNKAPVRQLTLKGKSIATYRSLTEAATVNRYTLSGIRACADGNIFQHKGFKWKYFNIEKTSQQNKRTLPVFNEYLWRKLNKPKTSRKNPIPVFNLSEHDLKGEKWKPIKDLDGVYLISNYGRVKTSSRFKKGNLNVWAKGIMKRLIPDGNSNKPTSCLLVASAGEVDHLWPV